MITKLPYTIENQITLLKQRGMLFRDEVFAANLLKNISYYRLKGYWWDMQSNCTLHTFKPDTYFENIIDRYDFDRSLRLILFDAIERIEIALRTKMIYHLSISHNSLWYLNTSLFENTIVNVNGRTKTLHRNITEELQRELDRSQEIFMKDHRDRYPDKHADAWKALEVASLGTLSKLYKCLQNQLPEKASIANEMGLNSTAVLSSWLESITYIRNIIAHHSRLWSRNMAKKPIDQLNNPSGKWFISPLIPVQSKKVFLIISCMIYLCNKIAPEHQIKSKILRLFEIYPSIPLYKLGFLNDWDKEPIWK